jgi:hypothetical protein
MALIKCVECGNEISDKAKICLKCGINIEHKEEPNIENADDAKGGFGDIIFEIGNLLNSPGAQALVNQYYANQAKMAETNKALKEQENLNNKVLKEQEISANKKFFIWQWVFTLILSLISFATILIMGHFDLLDKYVIGALMGSIIGYLFGQAVRRNTKG